MNWTQEVSPWLVSSLEIYDLTRRGRSRGDWRRRVREPFRGPGQTDLRAGGATQRPDPDFVTDLDELGSTPALVFRYELIN